MGVFSALKATAKAVSASKTTKSVDKAKKVNASMATGKGTSKAGSSKAGTGANATQNVVKKKGDADKKTYAENQNKRTVAKAKASQKAKARQKLQGKTKNSTENMKKKK